MAKKVLVVDDEKLIVKGIRFSLEQDGMEVDCAYDGEEALKMATENAYDMVLLDIMLPKMDGFEVCQHIREFSNMPSVMLTAKGDDMDKILGLEYGADDYITKPFNILEVKARIKAIMRRTAASQPKKEDSKVIEAGDLKLDCESRRLFILGKEVNLTAKEFDLLELLVNNPNKVYGRENLLNLVWGYGRCAYGRCSCAASERKDREQSERAEVCAYQMGRWVLLFSELVRCSHDKIKKIYRFYEQPEIQAGSFTYSYRRDPMCSFADRDAQFL